MISEHRLSLNWQRKCDNFTYQEINRDHVIRTESGHEIQGSAAPQYMGDSGLVNPEETLVAAISACHMLTFLVVAAKRKFVVEKYSDDAVGVLEKNTDGKMAITRVTLSPDIVFSDLAPNNGELDQLHRMAHTGCFIANSVNCEITVESR